MNTTMNITSSTDVNGAPVRKCLMFSSSLTLATVSPTLLTSKYLKGRARRCLKSLVLRVTSILLVVCVKTYVLNMLNKASKRAMAISPIASTSRVVNPLWTRTLSIIT